MSNISQFMASSGVEIGQQLQMPGALNNFTIGTKEFLRCGFLKAYASAYATFKSRVPYGGFVDCTPLAKNTVSALVTIETGIPNTGLYHNGTRYLLISTHSANANSSVKHSTDGITWTGSSLSGTQAAGYAHARISNTIFASFSDPTNSPVWYTTDFQNWSQSNIAAGVGIGSVAVNGANTLAVAIVGNASNTAVSGIYTSANASTWTARTGTGGQSMTNMKGVTWSPCANAFLIVGTNSGEMLINKTTDGFTQTTSLTDTSNTINSSSVLAFQQLVAHSSGVTLISSEKGRLKRTTDGTTWTTIDLAAQAGISAAQVSSGTVTRLWYDSISTKFFAFINNINASSIAGTNLFTSSDGITWTQTFMFRDASTTYPFVNLNSIGYTGVLTANSKTWMLSVESTSVRGIVDVTSKVTQTNPDWVGMLVPADTTQYVRIA